MVTKRAKAALAADRRHNSDPIPEDPVYNFETMQWTGTPTAKMKALVRAEQARRDKAAPAYHPPFVQPKSPPRSPPLVQPKPRPVSFVPDKALRVAGNVQDLRGQEKQFRPGSSSATASAAGIRAVRVPGETEHQRFVRVTRPTPQPAPQPAPPPTPLVRPKPTPTKVKPAAVHPVYAAAAAAVSARKPTGAARKML